MRIKLRKSDNCAWEKQMQHTWMDGWMFCILPVQDANKKLNVMKNFLREKTWSFLLLVVERGFSKTLDGNENQFKLSLEVWWVKRLKLIHLKLWKLKSCCHFARKQNLPSLQAIYRKYFTPLLVIAFAVGAKKSVISQIPKSSSNISKIIFWAKLKPDFWQGEQKT